jgi:pyruvate/2-oxoglutarate dehydrogenase complex dihydrolipoamide dehydrogenase (E3) component
MKKNHYDVIVIGGGAAGMVSSKTAQGIGKNVMIVEKEKMGGECTWSGCVPSKRLIHLSDMFYTAHLLKDEGLADISITPNLKKVMENVREKVLSVYSTHTPEKMEGPGLKITIGSPEFIDSHTIKIDDTKYTADKFILATGSSPAIPPIKGINEVPFLTNQNVFELEKPPKSMITLGSGPIGLEISQSFARLGSKVKVIHRSSRILKSDDLELTNMLKQKLIDEGVDILSEHTPLSVKTEGESIVLTVKDKNGESKELKADALFVSTGRTPNLSGLKLENAGVDYNKKGVVVNKKMQTTSSNIYACGDIVPPYQFSHVSEMEGIVAGVNVSLPIKRKANYEQIVWITFTAPELAHLGLTEEEAVDKYGKSVEIISYDFSSLDRAVTDDATFGKAKFILHKNGKILGVHILGKNAGELIHQAQLIRHFNKKFTDIKDIMYAYPTLSDSVRQPAKKAYVKKLQNNFFIKLIKKIMGK